MPSKTKHKLGTILKWTVFCVIAFFTIRFVVGCFDFRSLKERSADYLNNVEESFDLSFPNDITPIYQDNAIFIDGGVVYYYYEIENDPTMLLKNSSTVYEIERDTFEKWLNFAIKEITDDGKPSVKEEYKPFYTDTERYFCYMIETERRFVYLYVVYNPEENFLIVCREVIQYPKERFDYN